MLGMAYNRRLEINSVQLQIHFIRHVYSRLHEDTSYRPDSIVPNNGVVARVIHSGRVDKFGDA